MMYRVVGENKVSIYNPNNRFNRKRKDIIVNKKDKMNPSRKCVKQQQPNIQKEANSANIAGIAGNWIEAVGTIVSAIGSTPSKIFSEQTITDFNIIGNVLEAGRTAIAAEGVEGVLNNG